MRRHVSNESCSYVGGSSEAEGGRVGRLSRSLLVELALVDLLLDRVARDEAVHLDVLPLADAVGAVLRLQVPARVPVGVEDDDLVRGDEVDAEAGRLGRELQRCEPSSGG